MKAPHAATLGVLGWYLLLAPLQGSLGMQAPSSKVFDFDAPLSKWEKSQSFDSETECERAKNSLYHQRLLEFKQSTSRHIKSRLAHEVVRLQHGRCVAAADPRIMR
jgi:hypothetical protein